MGSYTRTKLAPNGTVLKGRYLGSADIIETATWQAVPLGTVPSDGLDLCIDADSAVRIAVTAAGLGGGDPVQGFRVAAGGSLVLRIEPGDIVQTRTA